MDPTLCRISAPSGAFNYQRKIRQFLWSHRSENETDLVIVSDEESVKVHGAVLLPLSDHLVDLLPPSCPCSKPAVCLPPFPRNVLAAAMEILYIGETAKLASQDDWVKIKEVFSLLRIKVDGVVGNFEGENIGGEHDNGEVDGGVILKIELDDMDDKNSVNPLDEQQINTYQQDIHKYNLNEVTGLFVCEKDNEEMNESINVKELEPRIRRDLKRRNVDILNKYDDSEEKQPSSFSQASKNVKESNVCGRELDGKIISYASKTQTGNKNQKICATAQSTAQSPKKYICCKCDYKTNRKNNFQKHFDRVHQKVSQNCSHCDFKTTHEFYLQRHTIKKHTAGVHQKIYHCEQCDFKTTWQENLKKHINGVHGNIDYHCDQCDYKTKWKANLKIHIKSVHENSSYLCNQCDYNTKWKANLRIHINGAHEKIFHPCNLCDYKTKWKTHLRRHILGVHENMSVEGPLLSSTPPPGNSKKYPQSTRKHLKKTKKNGDCQVFKKQRHGIDDAHAEDSAHKVAVSTKSDNPDQISDETCHKRSVINWKEKGMAVLPIRKTKLNENSLFE